MTPDLTRTFKVVNALLNTLAYNPPGARDEGFLFWLSWANHLGNTVFATQDAHGPIRHGLVVLSCKLGSPCSTASRGTTSCSACSSSCSRARPTQACPTTGQARSWAVG